MTTTTTTNNSNDLNGSSSLNISYVEIEKLLSNQNGINDANSRSKTATTNTLSSSSNKATSDFMQLKNLSKNNKQENERLKQMLRNGNWSPVHPIRKNLWTNLMELNKDLTITKTTAAAATKSTSAENKENKNPNLNKSHFVSNESEYIHYLNQIFGKCKYIYS